VHELPDRRDITGAQVVVPCTDLAEMLEFLTDRLGFRVEAISPADDPVAAVVSAHGIRLRLDRTATGPPPALRLLCRGDDVRGHVVAPNGMQIELVDADPPLVLPPLEPSITVSRASDAASWVVGRAGMQYRDLVPGRMGGRLIASHIRIVDGGPVPDYVHFHRIRFQLIYCAQGWVKVVYEDQGQPFVMEAGDCVLQPPLMRHQVLESSAGMEVVEIGSPAVHDTFGDLQMTLPTDHVHRDRDFGGQRFVRHVARDAVWTPWRAPGFECRDTGVSAATGGELAARVVRVTRVAPTSAWRSDAEVWLAFVLAGSIEITLSSQECGSEVVALAGGDCAAVPAGTTIAVASCSRDLELLEVAVAGGAQPPVATSAAS
jgi:mannose-6-phosphate isomerase-like protein (cupin superfamily)